MPLVGSERGRVLGYGDDGGPLAVVRHEQIQDAGPESVPGMGEWGRQFGCEGRHRVRPGALPLRPQQPERPGRRGRRVLVHAGVTSSSHGRYADAP
jgi:hypothetical protein